MKNLIFLLGISLAACSPNSAELTPLSTAVDSSGEFGATWSESSEGATTGFVYRLHIHKKNSSVLLNETNEVLRTSSIVDTELAWSTPTKLQINCLRGDVYFWVNRAVIDDQNIRIELDSACPTPIRDQVGLHLRHNNEK